MSKNNSLLFTHSLKISSSYVNVMHVHAEWTLLFGQEWDLITFPLFTFLTLPPPPRKTDNVFNNGIVDFVKCFET